MYCAAQRHAHRRRAMEGITPAIIDVPVGATLIQEGPEHGVSRRPPRFVGALQHPLRRQLRPGLSALLRRCRLGAGFPRRRPLRRDRGGFAATVSRSSTSRAPTAAAGLPQHVHRRSRWLPGDLSSHRARTPATWPPRPSAGSRPGGSTRPAPESSRRRLGARLRRPDVHGPPGPGAADRGPSSATRPLHARRGRGGRDGRVQLRHHEPPRHPGLPAMGRRPAVPRVPRFLLLAGLGTLDYKDYLGHGGNLVPPVMVSTPSGLFASDNALTDLTATACRKSRSAGFPR